MGLLWCVLLACAGKAPVATGGPTTASSSTDTSSTSTTPAPRVWTLTEVGGSDDVTWHPDGLLLVSDLLGAGSWPSSLLGAEVFAVDPATGDVSTYGTGLPLPLGSALAADGSLYVAAYGAVAGVWRVPPGGGAATEVVGGLSYPSGVVVLEDGAVLVTEWGANRISRVVDGVAAPFGALPGPVGIDRRADGVIVVGG